MRQFITGVIATIVLIVGYVYIPSAPLFAVLAGFVTALCYGIGRTDPWQPPS